LHSVEQRYPQEERVWNTLAEIYVRMEKPLKAGCVLLVSTRDETGDDSLRRKFLDHVGNASNDHWDLCRPYAWAAVCRAPLDQRVEARLAAIYGRDWRSSGTPAASPKLIRLFAAVVLGVALLRLFHWL